MTSRRAMTRGPLRAAVVTALAIACGAPAAAQRVSAPDLTAAFLYNFAKFAVWPDESFPVDAPLVMCVVDDEAVASALERMTKGQTVGGHAIQTRRVGADASGRACQVLYASGLDATRSTRLLGILKGAPVLTVSDCTRFAELGGVAHFFVENDRMRFAINVEAAQRAHVVLSSRLLSLATIVKDDPHAAQP